MTFVVRCAVLAAALLALPHFEELEPLAAAFATVGTGIALSIALAANVGALEVGLGALSGLAYTMLSPHSDALAGGILFTAAYGARALRVPSANGVAVHVVMACACGGIASFVVGWYAYAPWVLRPASLVVATVLAASPLAIVADDPIAFRLRCLAGRQFGLSRARLLRAAAVRRQYMRARNALPRLARQRVASAWNALLATASARSDARGARANALDRRLGAYLRGVGAVARALTQARDLEQRIDDSILTELSLEGDDLTARAEALAEVEQPL